MTEIRKPDWLPDWKNPDNYPEPDDLSREQWAWQFLRRNTKYQKSWQGLFRNDPVKKTDLRSGTHSVFSIDWNELAVNWGIRGFPPDPSEYQPKMLFFDSALFISASPLVEKVDSQKALAPRNNKEIVLRVPLERSASALVDAFKFVIGYQQEVIGFSGFAQNPSRNRIDKFPEYLRLLDANTVGVDVGAFVSHVYPYLQEEKGWIARIKALIKALNRAKAIVEYDYIRIPSMTGVRHEGESG